MTLSPHAQNLRAGQKMGDLQFIDTMIRDGLWDAFNGYHMGQTAENVAEKWQISRDQQDEFAVASQNKAEAAQKAGKFADEIVAYTVKGRKGDTIVDQDEYIRHGATIEAMQKLRPAFTKDGSVTAANASGLNDGAAGALLMSADEAEKRGIEPLARIASYATAGLDPSIMGVGPIYASRKALEKAGWKAEDLDLVEANEAFAAQACAVNKVAALMPAITRPPVSNADLLRQREGRLFPGTRHRTLRRSRSGAQPGQDCADAAKTLNWVAEILSPYSRIDKLNHQARFGVAKLEQAA